MRPSIAVQQHRTEILAMLQKYRSQTHGSLDQLYVPLYEGVRHEFYDNDDLREWLVQYFDDYVVENQPVKGTYGLIWFLSKQNSIPGYFAVKPESGGQSRHPLGQSGSTAPPMPAQNTRSVATCWIA